MADHGQQSSQSPPASPLEKELKPPSITLLPESPLQPLEFDLQVFPAELSTTPSVDIIAVHDLGEKAEEAWTDGAGWTAGRTKDVILRERDRDVSPSASPSAHDKPAPIRRRTGEAAVELKGKSPEQPSATLDVQAQGGARVWIPGKGLRKSSKDRFRSTEGSARSSSEWESSQPVNWLRDLLSPDVPRSRILAFSYPAPNFEKKSTSWIAYVQHVAEQLLERVRDHRRTAEQQDVPIVFIGYGFGGVIIQKAIELLVAVKPLEQVGAGTQSVVKELESPEKTSHEPEPGNEEIQSPIDEKQHKKGRKVVSVPGGIYLALFLDTPFPEPEHEDGHEERLFPPNTNVRMCDIIRQIEEHEKDSDVLERVWAGLVDAYDKTPDKEDIDVTWLYSQAKMARQHELSPTELIADKLAVSTAIDITMTSVATFRHRRLGIISDADDYIYKAIRARIQSTLLFQGIYLRNPELVETILGCEPLTVVEDIEGKLTPLHAAAQLSPANDEIVTILLNKRKDDIMQRDELGRVPLHLAIAAAWEAKPPEGLDRAEFANVIGYLMRNMQRTDLDIKDNDGRSPWDPLCEPGECICADFVAINYNDMRPITAPEECAATWIRDLRDTLEPISGPALDDDLKKPTKPIVPEKDSARYHASVAATGTVAEFYHVFESNGMQKVPRERINLKTPNVYDMIYHPRRGCAKILEYSRMKEESQNFRCRWIHIPSNNEQWLSDLILSLGVRDDSMEDQRHDGLSVFNRYMNPHAKKYEFRTIIVEPERPPAAPGPRLATVPEEPTQHSATAPNGTLGQSSQAPWASLCRIEGLTGDKTIALFMPILSYESYADWEAVVRIIKQTSKEQQFGARKQAMPTGRYRNRRRWSDSSQADKDRARLREVTTLVNGYISPSGDEQPLHCRRTLDQHSYYMLDTTERRDKDQVVYRWVEKQKDSLESADLQKPTPIIMVDQLWLWVLPDGTVITGIPNTQRPSEKYNIRKLLSEEIETNKTRNAIRGPDDLVGVVLETCLEIMTREGPSGVKLQECFQSSINAIAEDEAVAMEEFLATVKKLANSPEPFHLTADIDSFSQISRESTQLIEIIDIRDELDIIRSVLTTQKRVLKQLRGVIRSQGRGSTLDDTEIVKTVVKTADTNAGKAAGDTAFKGTVVVEDAIRIVDDNLLRVEEMDGSATRVHAELKQLMEFKQQQASGWEARYAKKMSEQGQRQNTIMLVFTIVTIIFLPMSFIASFFAINVNQFPRDQDSDEPHWPLATISIYIFGISIAFSGTILVLVRMWFAHRKRKNRRRQTHRQHRPTERASSRHDHPHPGRPRPSNDDDVHVSDEDTHEDWESDYTVDDNSGYAHLFNRWTWHTRIPYVRRLWEWKLYKIRRQKHMMRRSQEGMEWDYPLSRWRYGIVWVFKKLGRSIRRRMRRRREVNGRPGARRGSSFFGAGDREEAECASDDEKARDQQLGMEHRGRVMERREWAADVAKRVGTWFKFGFERDDRAEVGDREEGEMVQGGAEGAAEDVGQGGRRSLRSVFRRRKRVEDEEMGIVEGS